VTEGIDLNRPSASRVYDYYLGGSHNFQADREMAQRAVQDWPALPQIMRANRAFLRRAVTYLAGQGVRQFLDIGSGIPTAGNVHEVAQQLDPRSRVVYVDIDPVAVAHSEAILTGDPESVVVNGDFRSPATLLGDPAVQAHLDFERPVGLLCVALLHFIGDEARPAELLESFRAALAPGSHLVLSHATHEFDPTGRAEFHRSLYRQTATPMTMRGQAEVEAFFSGLELVEPGVVLGEAWRPDDPEAALRAEHLPFWVGVGRKP
jgi:SAM-dependent methyltransferase